MSRLWPPLEPPQTPLARYRALSPLAGVHVSPLQLGGMSIGDKWQSIGMGAMDKETSFKLLDAYYDAGGNIIDTANSYQGGSSEEFIGEWVEARGIRSSIVLATKYTTNSMRHQPSSKHKILYTGNNLKSLRVSVDASLKRLRTDYIDILYMHWWDYTTDVEEIMNGLHQLVLDGKVLYLGVSDSPAWFVAKANQYARDHGKSPFVIYQGKWNVLTRDFERDILPMARHEGLALAPWDVLCSGHIRTDAEEQRRLESGEHGRTLIGDWRRNDEEKKMCKLLEEIATEIGAASIQAVAIAYLMQKTPYVFPIVGMRKVEQLHANIEALNVALTPDHIARIEGAVNFKPGFPHDMLGDGTRTNFMIAASAHVDRVPAVQPIRPQ